MTISWSSRQQQRVGNLLDRYPVASARCEALARSLLVVARERDVHAKMWRLVPSEGRYVVPKVKLARPWYFHVTTEVEAHAVDALTGADGTAVENYLERHWTEVDAIVWREER